MKCRTCLKEFTCSKEEEVWKRQCYDCYKSFKGMPRIQTMGQAQGVLIISHPDCTKEEIDKWIEKKYGSVNTPSNWGAVEQTGRNYKVWWNCQNDD